jgi:hypothetical protein
MAGVAGVAALGVMAARRIGERRAADAYARAAGELGPTVELRGERVRLPVAFHRTDGFTAILGADLGRVTALLPSSALHPVRLAEDRAAIFVGAYRHHEMTMAGGAGETRTAWPYGEVLVAALVTRRAAPPMAPLIASSLFGLGAFVLYLPVTTRLAMDAGRLWGLPKFVADIDFAEGEAERVAEVGEGGREILALRVRPAGRLVVDRAPTILYGVRDGQLVEVSLPGITHQQSRFGRSGGSLRLGDHAVADTLRSLSISAEPVATTNVVLSRFVMPEGRIVGPARPYLGYAGVERAFGRYTVRHAGTVPVDQYANRRPVDWWVAPSAPERAPVEPESPAPIPAGA